MSEICPVCGKEFEVTWPHLWTYRRGNRMVCSYSCVRAYDRKEGEELMRRNGEQIETARQLAEAMERGEEPLEWLEAQGYGNPRKAYQNLKAAAQNDPELAEKFPRKRAPRKTEPAEEPAKVTAEEPEEIAEEDFFMVTAVKNKTLGEFYFDHDHNCIDWRNRFGDEVSLDVDGWKMMVKKLPGILRYLGVEV